MEDIITQVQEGVPNTAPLTQSVTQAPTWLQNADEATVGYVQNKGWTDPAQVLDSYRNLEKLFGADKANNSIVLPKPDADPKEWDAVYDRLGRPAEPKGYDVPLPEFGDKTLHENTLAKMREIGLTKTQGEQLANWYNGEIAKMNQQFIAQQQQAFDQEDAALKSEWGAAFDQNVGYGKAAVAALQLPGDTIEKISAAIGHKATMELFYRIGSGMKEDAFVSSNNGTGFNSVMTPAQAKAEIKALSEDRNFKTNLLNKDSAAMAKWTRLHEYAFPEG